MTQSDIIVRGARVHNLKNVSVTLPRYKFIVFSGLSGSGKSSLAFDTIYAEGQRRYMESLSAYARQFLDQLDKPDIDQIEGLSPAISIDQKNASSNPRSTVGTITEIYDYLRLLFSSIGIPHCPNCDTPVQTQSAEEIVTTLMGWPENSRLVLMAPLVTEKKGEYKQLFEDLQKEGFSRVEVNGEMMALADGITLDKKFKHTIRLVVDRLKINEENRSRIFQSVETTLQHAKGLLLAQLPDEGKEQLFSQHLSCPNCQTSIAELSPRLFSFNSPLGACPSCNGLGEKLDFDPDLVIEFPENPIKTCTGKVLNLNNTLYGRAALRTMVKYDVDAKTRFCDLTDTQKNVLLYGREDAVDDNPYLDNSAGEYRGIRAKWEGIMTNLRRRYFQTQSEGMRFYFRSFMTAKPCTLCKGARLKASALSVKVGDVNLATLTAKNVGALVAFFEKLKLSEQEIEISHQVLKEIKERLSFLNNVGLDYLALNRKSGTLSGGEFQRIRLATQIGAGLTGVLYVLDEPSIGLHQRDNQRLLDTLKRLRDLGNTLIVVEHDEDTFLEADYIVEIGPGAGNTGGEIVFSGTKSEFLKKGKTLTAEYLQGKKSIAVPEKRRAPKDKGVLTIHGASENNLKSITVDFPLGRLIAVTGVSGSGKSTLIHDILYKALMRHFYTSKERPGAHDSISGLNHLDKMIAIDQSPIGRTPRSNPATYTGVFSAIRDLFVQTKEAKVRGYKPGRFSFNVKGGRCEACEGDGVKKIEMHFLSDIYVTCDICKGKRYNAETLEVTYKGYTISDVLNMTINAASDLFDAIPAIKNKLRTLQDVGLGYVHLGQNATTLSGGEAQRIKLAKELSKRGTGKTLYLLDEPTTGLHFQDVQCLLNVFNRLVDAGNTLIVIEHHLDVIKSADYIVDLGPEGGDKGGTLVATGTPETVSNVKKSFTGIFLKKLLPS